MATATAARPRTLRESSVLAASGRVDRQSGTIKGVRVLGFSSRNGHRYTRDALSEARPLYQGVRVYLDHDRSGAERKMNDFVGVLKNVTLAEDGLRGDLQILQTHPSAALVLERAERFPQTLGLSHFAQGEVERQNGEMVVTHISEVRSVDLVCDPATSGGLFEDVGDGVMDGGDVAGPTTLGQAAANAPDRSRKQLEIEAMLKEVRRVASEMVSDDTASVGERTQRRLSALNAAFDEAEAAILDAMQSDGGKVKTIPAARISESHDAERFDIPKDTRKFAQWLGSSGHRRTRSPLTESQQRQRRFLDKIR